MKQARSSLVTLVLGFACSAIASTTIPGHFILANLKADPDSDVLLPLLLSIAAAGVFVHFCYLLSRVGQDTPMPWPRWIGESMLGGFTAWVAAGLYYTFGPSTTQIGLSIAGVFGGFFGQRGLIWIVMTIARLKNLPPPPTPPGGGPSGT